MLGLVRATIIHIIKGTQKTYDKKNKGNLKGWY